MRSLSASATREAVLHGDLHHDNVLRGTREPWLAIDPHGLVGDPGYEIGSILFNPDPDDRDPALTALVPARLRQLSAALGEPVDRLAAWGFVKAVLSEVWTADSGGHHPAPATSPTSCALPESRRRTVPPRDAGDDRDRVAGLHTVAPRRAMSRTIRRPPPPSGSRRAPAGSVLRPAL